MTTPSVPASYSFAELIRDVSEILQQIVQQQPTLLSLVQFPGRVARQHKHEWPELALTPEQTTLTAAIANNTATVFNVADTSPFRVNAICRVDGKDEILKVTALDATAKTLTVTRGYGSSTKASSIAKDTAIIVVSKPLAESSRASLSGGATAPEMNWNECEIFDGEAVVSNSQGPVYGISASADDPVGALMNFNVQQELLKMQRRMNTALIYGRRVVRESGNPIGTMGGLLQFHEGSANIVDAAGNQISDTTLGDAMEKAFQSGCPGLDTILCNSIQARNISAIYKTKLVSQRGDTTAGQVIYQVQPDFPIRGYITTVVVDPNFPQDKVSIFSKAMINWVWLNGRRPTDKASESPGDDFVARRIVAEGTAEFQNWADAAALVTNLSTQLKK